MDGGTAELRQFGSLPMAGRLGRGAPVGGGVSGGTGGQGSVTLGLSDRLQLLGERATPAGAQEGRQAPAQALGGLLPGVIAEELAHGVSGEVVLRGEGPVRGGPGPPAPVPEQQPLRGPPACLPCDRAKTALASGQGPQRGRPLWQLLKPKSRLRPGPLAQRRQPPRGGGAAERGAALPEARSEGSTRPSRTWRGWRSRSPAGPGRSYGSSTLPRCHGCGGSRGLPACLEVPQDQGEGTSAQGPRARTVPPAAPAPALQTGRPVTLRGQPASWPRAEEVRVGCTGAPRGRRGDSGGERVRACSGPAPGLLAPPSPSLNRAQPLGPRPKAVWKIGGPWP